MRRSCLIAAALLAGVALWRPAHAQSDYTVAASWGLLGAWKPNCNAPVVESNSLYIYEGQANKLVLRRDTGNGIQGANTVTSVKSSSPTHIEYLITFADTATPQTRKHVLMKSSNGKAFRAVVNQHLGTGAFSVVDGKFTANGAATPWVVRCY